MNPKKEATPQPKELYGIRLTSLTDEAIGNILAIYKGTLRHPDDNYPQNGVMPNPDQLRDHLARFKHDALTIPTTFSPRSVLRFDAAVHDLFSITVDLNSNDPEAADPSTPLGAHALAAQAEFEARLNNWLSANRIGIPIRQ